MGSESMQNMASCKSHKSHGLVTTYGVVKLGHHWCPGMNWTNDDLWRKLYLSKTLHWNLNRNIIFLFKITRLKISCKMTSSILVDYKCINRTTYNVTSYNIALDPSHKSRNALFCNINVHISVTKWRIGEYGTGSLTDMQKMSHK